MLIHLLIVYGALSLLFTLTMGLFFSRIGKRFPRPAVPSEKAEPQTAASQVPAPLISESRRALEKVTVVSNVPALSYSHGPAKGL